MVFKALQTYDNGQVVRWIDAPATDGTEPEHPAPVLRLVKADSATTGTSTATAPAVTAAKGATAGTEQAAADSAPRHDGTARLLGGGALAVALLAVVLAFVTRVRPRPAATGREPWPAAARRSPGQPRDAADLAGGTPVVLLVAIALIGLSAARAAAHAAVVATTPAAGTALDTAPTTVSVRFSEAVQATSDAIRVLTADGTRVDRGGATVEPSHSDTVAVALRSGLGRGTYTVAWRVTSADSHPVHGAFAFAVGRTGSVLAPLADADHGASPTVTGLVHLARGIGYAGLALLIGAVGIGFLLDGGTGRASVGRQARAGGLVLTVSAAVSLLAQGPYAAGTGLTSLFDPALLHDTLSGRTGVTEALRVVLAAALTLAMGAGATGTATGTGTGTGTTGSLETSGTPNRRHRERRRCRKRRRRSAPRRKARCRRPRRQHRHPAPTGGPVPPRGSVPPRTRPSRS